MSTVSSSIRWGMIITGALMLAACASKPTVSEFQCKAGDWQTIGHRDGSLGYESTRLLAHQEACGEFGIVPNRDTYMAGWRAGVGEYCVPDNGFRLGERGGRASAACQGALKQPFVSAFNDGRRLYSARREVDQLQRQLRDSGTRLEAIKHEMIDLTAAQLDMTLLPEDRLHLIQEMDELRTERQAIKEQIPGLEEELYVRQAELEGLSQELAEIGYIQ